MAMIAFIKIASQNVNGATHYFGYDGLGSTKFLTAQDGSITDTYQYDAYGEVTSQTGNTDNLYLYTGEQFDRSLNQYYLRARYYNQGVGRFTQMDSWQGRASNPTTLNKYLYANGAPTIYTDPSGHMSLGSTSVASNIQSSLMQMTRYSNYLFQAYDKAQSVVGFIDLMNAVRTVFGQTTTFDRKAAIRTGIPRVDYSEAIRSASYNMPLGIGTGLGSWSSEFARTKPSVEGFLVYMPLISTGVGDKSTITTPTKVTWGKEKVPVKIVFGSTNKRAYGSLFGIGMQTKGGGKGKTTNRQLVRMDYHVPAKNHGGSSGVKGEELAYWVDGDFHYHVNKW